MAGVALQTWSFLGSSLHSSQLPQNTGPAGASSARALLPEPYGVSTPISAVQVVTGNVSNEPTNATSCATLASPPIVAPGC